MNIGEVSPLCDEVARLKLILDDEMKEKKTVLVGGGSVKVW